MESTEKTGLAGRVHTELNCLPVENAEYQRIMTLKHAEENKPKNVASKSTDTNLAAILGGGQRTVIDNFIVSLLWLEFVARANELHRKLLLSSPNHSRTRTFAWR